MKLTPTLLLLLAGCVTVTQHPVRNYTIGAVQTISAGELLLTYEEKELLYVGRPDDLLKITYRKGTTTEDIQYSIEVSRIIRYQDFVIEIIKADNQHVTYKILADATPTLFEKLVEHVDETETKTEIETETEEENDE